MKKHVHVIQFETLEAFVAEDLVKGGIVRVVALNITEGRSAAIPELRMVTIGVHARAINADGHLLACYLPITRIQLYNGRRESDPAWQKYDAAWEKAKALKERVVVYLNSLAADKGFIVRTAGVIDLGDVSLLSAVWSSDPLHQQQNEDGDV
ncbi:MAG: hypothetical protein GY803_20405 [Chloroflexi bacterium]|nr:hypothetical protein [Chloroflexota bacterium]